MSTLLAPAGFVMTEEGLFYLDRRLVLDPFEVFPREPVLSTTAWPSHFVITRAAGGPLRRAVRLSRVGAMSGRAPLALAALDLRVDFGEALHLTRFFGLLEHRPAAPLPFSAEFIRWE